MKKHIFINNTNSGIWLTNNISSSDKKIVNNTFHNNSTAIYTDKLEELILSNNIFSKNNLDIGVAATESMNKLYLEGLKYNFSTNNLNNFCKKAVLIYPSYCLDSFTDLESNKINISNIGFINAGSVSSLWNFRLIQTSSLKNNGDPTLRNLDGKRSDPGAYGGFPELCDISYGNNYCNLDFDFLKDTINPSPSIIPTSATIIPSVDPKYDLNTDSKVDILDLISLIKVIFN